MEEIKATYCAHLKDDRTRIEQFIFETDTLLYEKILKSIEIMNEVSPQHKDFIFNDGLALLIAKHYILKNNIMIKQHGPNFRNELGHPIEIKWFAGSSNIMFSKKMSWTELYLIDVSLFREHKYKCYRIKVSSNDKLWLKLYNEYNNSIEYYRKRNFIAPISIDDILAQLPSNKIDILVTENLF